MKYLFIGIGKLFTLFLWALCQFFILLWHFNVKHNQSAKDFYEGIDVGNMGEDGLRWALIFLVLSIITSIFGFGGIAVGAAGIAKVLFFIFLVLFVLSLIAASRSENLAD
jgi:uncharacterized membrane protein YtjA (UPF0391 family)